MPLIFTVYYYGPHSPPVAYTFVVVRSGILQRLCISAVVWIVAPSNRQHVFQQAAAARGGSRTRQEQEKVVPTGKWQMRICIVLDMHKALCETEDPRCLILLPSFLYSIFFLSFFLLKRKCAFYDCRDGPFGDGLVIYWALECVQCSLKSIIATQTCLANCLVANFTVFGVYILG